MSMPPFLITGTEIATVLGVAGVAGQFAAPLFRRREAILAVQLGASCCHAGSYGLLGQDTAAAVCLTGAAQTVATLAIRNALWRTGTGVLFLLAALLVGVLTYAGLPTILAVTACGLTMIGRLQADTLRLRGVQLTAAPFGAAHDVLIGAWPGLVGATLSFGIAALAFRRERRARRGGCQLNSSAAAS